MAWKDATEILVGSDGQVYTADVGTALPTTADATPNAAFVGLGYHAESGLTLNKGFEVVEFKAWQALRPVRRERQQEDLTLTFELLQWNEENVPLAFGGGEIVSDGASGFRYNPPEDQEAIDEKSLVADVNDGDDRVRVVIPRGSITDGTEVQFQRTEMGTLKVAFKTLEPPAGQRPWYMLFNNDNGAFTAGS